MHYHVVLIDEDGEHPQRPVTFATQDEAEREARALLFTREALGWRAQRYPGRAWRPQEVAVYLDRSRPGKRRYPALELVVVRCANGAERTPGCYLHGRAPEPDADSD